MAVKRKAVQFEFWYLKLMKTTKQVEHSDYSLSITDSKIVDLLENRYILIIKCFSWSSTMLHCVFDVALPEHNTFKLVSFFI